MRALTHEHTSQRTDCANTSLTLGIMVQLNGPCSGLHVPDARSDGVCQQTCPALSRNQITDLEIGLARRTDILNVSFHLWRPGRDQLILSSKVFNLFSTWLTTVSMTNRRAEERCGICELITMTQSLLVRRFVALERVRIDNIGGIFESLQA